MPQEVRSTLEVRRAAIPVLRGSLVLAVLTACAYRLHLNTAAAGFVFLIAVVLNCLDCGPLAATAVSIVAVGCLDYFFIDPLFTFTVADPVDVAALAALLTSSLLVSRLAARARLEARTARRDRRHLERLYELAQRLLAMDPLRLDPSRLIAAIRDVFDLQAAAFFDAATAELSIAGDAGGDLCEQTREAYILGRDSTEPSRQVAFRRVGTAARTLGTLGVRGLEDEQRMAGPVAALAAAGLERARMVREASRAAAEAQSETLRAAILDALAHEFRTPLATILTAAGGINEARPLRAEQAELAEIVETEALRLSNLTSHLLRVARLDRDQVKAGLEPADLTAVIESLVQRYSRQMPERQIVFHADRAVAEVPVDVDLYQVALSQLLDNACRYSPPGSPVKVAVSIACGSVAVTVWNAGSPIAPAERDRIFERFYRGPEARRVPSGTGLGLYVARKIALAHGGSLDLETGAAADGGIAFRLSIPLPAGASGLGDASSCRNSKAS